MKVLISDNLGEAGIRMLQEEEKIEVDVKTGLDPESLKNIIEGYDALIIRSATKVTADLLNAATRLKVVGRAGIGLDNVDIPAATKHGIIVMNTPGGNVITTAEHAIGMLLALSRNVPEGTASLKAGRWDKKKLQGREIFNKTLGVVGYGKIGSIVADLASGLKMKVIVYDPYVTPEQIEKAGFESVSLEELYRRSDYITVHVPKFKETIGLLNKEAFEQMKDGVMIINCARGGIVDEDSLYNALQSGKVAGAALDVFENEPPGTCPLIEHEHLICTPHLGASTQEAQTKVAVDVAGQVIDYLKYGTIMNAVNVPSVTGDLLKKLRPLLTLADHIGSLQTQLIRGPIEEVTIEYAGDYDGLDLSPVTIAVIRGLLAPVVKDDVNFVNAQVLAKERGIKVKEIKSDTPEEYINLITVRVATPKVTNTVSGTLFGKNKMRIVKINNFRLELIPQGHLALVYTLDKPGAIGSFSSLLGHKKISIDQMHLGREETGKMNIIYLKTHIRISDNVVEQLLDLPLIISVTRLEFES
jgi:D-3-phosphoglycerate dehydrogenase / 2-oxoglutarate reductase